MATIREKDKGQWQGQIRRKGWPYQTATFPSKKEAQGWARKVETEMDRGVFVDQTEARNTTFGQLIEIYLKKVTAKRPSKNSRTAERCRLERFIREEPKLCSHAVACTVGKRRQVPSHPHQFMPSQKACDDQGSQRHSHDEQQPGPLHGH